MENILRKIAQDTTKFDVGDEEGWRELYEPLYADAPDSIGTIKDIQYGPADRNQLDVYFPLKDNTEGKPVVFFVHGGGFFSGGKGWSEKCWANVGFYFAQNGFVTVLVNHRLVPNVEYPGGADDMQLAREWVYNHIGSEKYGQGSANKVVLLGHSSGGAHIAMNLYAAAGDPDRIPSTPIFPPVAGVLYLSVPFWFDRTKPVRQKVIRHYWGSDSEAVWGPRSALGLFKSLPGDSPLLDYEQLPVYVGSVQWEVKETADATVAFFNAYRERSIPRGTLPVLHVQDRHNHVSNVLSIGTTDSAQAERLLEFINSCVERVDRRAKRTP
ncbi:alpha/beta-hydrolase [Aspergillus uvarum CBS 121591]|uniref:Alpha/beta-hydrolase n=1 Tax=Aspergillus uvarum CBS 121591 TaxID=1448315 RepID=A0A319E0F9_9EURO|nr:alpha/beta-hydrolase [Aspergillus uvarum CBS 121591]PYH84592.1 alpha/beta-hydrolase [Aspergillus uvarum CBS 121591]